MQRGSFLSTLVLDQFAPGGNNAGRGSKVAVGAFSCLWFKRKMCSILLLVKNNNKKLFTTGSCLLRNYIWSESFVCVCRGVCVCVCLNSNVYRSFIKADSRRKQSLNTAIWPALASAGCLQTSSIWRVAEAASHCGFWIAAIWLTSSQALATFKTSWSLVNTDHEALASVIIIVMSDDKLPGLTYYGPDWAQLGLGV